MKLVGHRKQCNTRINVREEKRTSSTASGEEECAERSIWI